MFFVSLLLSFLIELLLLPLRITPGASLGVPLSMPAAAVSLKRRMHDFVLVQLIRLQ